MRACPPSRHDLGQPLTTIRVAAQMLKRQSGAGETLAEELAGIDDATTHMWSMLGELMDVVRLDAGRALDLHWEPVDLVALVRQEATAAARAAGSHQIHR